MLDVRVEYDCPLFEYLQEACFPNNISEVIDYSLEHKCFYDLVHIIEDNFFDDIDEDTLWQWLEDNVESLLEQLKQIKEG